MTHQTGLDFAPGTTDATKMLVGKMFTPTELFSAYRAACVQCGTRDIVMTVSEQDPSGFEAMARSSYIDTAKRILAGKAAPVFMRGILSRSAQMMMDLPGDSDAFWLLVIRRNSTDVPAMCVLYGLQYEVENTASAN